MRIAKLVMKHSKKMLENMGIWFDDTKKCCGIEEKIQDNLLKKGIFEINADNFTNIRIIFI